MTTLLLSVLPIAGIAAVFLYALVTGLRMYRSNGQVSIFGVAATIAGFAVGRIADRFLALPRYLDDWVNYRDGPASQASTGSVRFLAILSVEVALLFLFAAAVGLVVITLIRRDFARQSHPGERSLELPLLGGLFAFAVGITARAKLAALLAFAMARSHLL
jgi:hypothetical protein